MCDEAAPDSDPSFDSTQVQGPLVFSCIQCKCIMGDSYSIVASNEALGVIVLSAASNIQRCQEVYTSKSGPDVGSTYFTFMCVTCKAAVGKFYLTTSKDLDELREKFSFAVDSISSYELGRSQVGKVFEFDKSEGDVPADERVEPRSIDLIKSLSEDVGKVVHRIVVSLFLGNYPFSDLSRRNGNTGAFGQG